MFLLATRCPAADWIVVQGGLSPDKLLAVAVVPQKTEFIDEADGTVLLVDVKSQKRIGPLEEVDSTGGTWGKTNENVRCAWSPDSKLLLVNFRIGRLMHSFQIYRILERRAIPLKLPEASSNPKSKILDVLTTNANPGSEVLISKDGAIIQRSYGYVPKPGHYEEDYSKYGLKDFDESGGVLLFRYELQKDGSIKLADITAEPDH